VINMMYILSGYKTSVYVPAGDFSVKTCNTWIKQYNSNFNRMTTKHWEEILEYFNIACDSEIERVSNQLILDKEQEALSMSSSLSASSEE
jgi:hypothetical protein